MKKMLLFRMMTVGLLLMSSTCVWADKVTLVTGEWTPYSSETLEGYGFIAEIITEVLADVDVTPEYEFHPWTRCYSLVKRGKVWAAFPYSYTEERAADVLFSETVWESTSKFFYYNKERPYPYENLEDLLPYKIAGVKGYFYEQSFQDSGLDVSYTSDELSALKRLAAGRVDLMPLNELVGWALIRKHFPDEVEKFGTLEKALRKSGLMLIVSKEYPGGEEFLQQFNEAFRRVKQTDAYKAILTKYGLQP
ncbi:MAG: amino acid ABC transporter substrate-binding protein [bacterium]|nr:amino acid ABC transporter substrate-binding protein [bacterium]